MRRAIKKRESALRNRSMCSESFIEIVYCELKPWALSWHE